MMTAIGTLESNKLQEIQQKQEDKLIVMMNMSKMRLFQFD
jgi:hypothetical protein